MRTCIVTGAAGFIGFHLSRKLLGEGVRVVGIDNMNDYYSTSLKRDRLALLREPLFDFVEADVTDTSAMDTAFASARPEVVFHLAAQAGVRHSLAHPMAYVQTNVTGFMNVLDMSQKYDADHLVYASSSSVYGDTSPSPFSVDVPADHPVSMYAATKRANELMAHAFSHLHSLPTTGLRFFTVYGPWGRPDMAYFRFAEAIQKGAPITIYGDGAALRDFTYVDDIVKGIIAVGAQPASPKTDWTLESEDSTATSTAPWRIHNIGYGRQVSVTQLVGLLEERLGRPAIRRHADPVPGDVGSTHADTRRFQAEFGVTAATPLEDGITHFVDWFRSYNR